MAGTSGKPIVQKLGLKPGFCIFVDGLSVPYRDIVGELPQKNIDTGMGIEAKHLPRLTERFYRVDSSRASNTGGTGLGLAIVKHIVHRHRGRLPARRKL